MLKQRVLTAIPLAAFVLWGIITQPADHILYALLVVMLIAGWEWARLSGVTNVFLRAAYAVVIAVNAYIVQQALNHGSQWLQLILMLTIVCWLVVIYHMFSKGPQAATNKISGLKLLIGFVALIPPLLALVLIRAEDAGWLFFCLSIVWVADIGAYFSGKRFGKNKLAENLSPGKTKEGLYGAVFFTVVYSFIAGLYIELHVIELLMLMIIVALATLISVAGDLSISLLKREVGLKDTGNILPGHGGILDRIDSVLSSAPLLALLLTAVIF